MPFNAGTTTRDVEVSVGASKPTKALSTKSEVSTEVDAKG